MGSFVKYAVQAPLHTNINSFRIRVPQGGNLNSNWVSHLGNNVVDLGHTNKI